jgi:hypothetical protein
VPMGNIKVKSDCTMTIFSWLQDEHRNWKPWMENTFTGVAS